MRGNRQARDVGWTILASGRSTKTTTEEKTTTKTEEVDQHYSLQERMNQNQTQEEVGEVALDAFQKWTNLKQTLGGHGTQEEVQSKTKSSESIDYRKVGVRQCASGKWEVRVSGAGRKRNLGTFDTQLQAAIVNEVGRKMLKSECTAETTAEEFDNYVRQARRAALCVLEKSVDQKQKQKEA